jgi:Na+-transporting NADH:ubiquinone oxidoreductase subunit A
MAPGFGQYSASALFPSRWLSTRKAWDLGTNLNGGHRAMVATGLYDRVLPMNILVDQLVRAVLAHDVEEAVQLGLLEVDPEDFALCSFVCPSKTDLVGIIRKGLDEAAAEGL